jgi:hypothetical protein
MPVNTFIVGFFFIRNIKVNIHGMVILVSYAGAGFKTSIGGYKLSAQHNLTFVLSQYICMIRNLNGK